MKRNYLPVVLFLFAVLAFINVNCEKGAYQLEAQQIELKKENTKTDILTKQNIVGAFKDSCSVIQ